MVQILSSTQRGLDYEFQNHTAIRNKIISVVSYIVACSTAILQPCSSLAAPTNKIYNVIENHEAAVRADRLKLSTTPTNYLTDHKYSTINQPNRFQSSNNDSDLHRFPRPSKNLNSGSKRKYSYVYQKPDCWSSNYTDDKHKHT